MQYRPTGMGRYAGVGHGLLCKELNHFGTMELGCQYQWSGSFGILGVHMFRIHAEVGLQLFESTLDEDVDELLRHDCGRHGSGLSILIVFRIKK